MKSSPVQRLWVLLPSVLAACAVTDVGNPQTEPEPEPETEVVVEVRAFEANMPNALTLRSGIEITHAWVALDSFAVQPCEPEGDDEEAEGAEDLEPIAIEGSVVVDLITGTSFPEPLRLTTIGRDFCGLSFEITEARRAQAPSIPEDLDGLSVMVRGFRSDRTPFQVQADFSSSVEMEAEAVVEEGEGLLLGFAADAWFDEKTLDSIDGPAPIMINVADNDAVYDAFREEFASSSWLFPDYDRDGELDPRELSSPLGRGESEDTPFD